MRRKGQQRGSVRRVNGKWSITFSQWQNTIGGDLQYKSVERTIPNSERMTKRQAKDAGYEQFVVAANGPAALPQGVATLQQFIDGRFWPAHSITLKKGGRNHLGIDVPIH